MKLLSTQDKLFAIFAVLFYVFAMTWNPASIGMAANFAINTVATIVVMLALALLFVRLRHGVIPIADKYLARQLHKTMLDRKGKPWLGKDHVYLIQDNWRIRLVGTIGRFHIEDVSNDDAGQIDPKGSMADIILVSGRWSIVHRIVTSSKTTSGPTVATIDIAGPGPKFARTGVTMMDESEIRALLYDLSRAEEIPVTDE